MNIIVAADKNWGIGFKGNLLTHIKEDMKFFKEMTVGKAVIMGRETFLSLPGQKPLPDRKNFVLTTDSAMCIVKKDNSIIIPTQIMDSEGNSYYDNINIDILKVGHHGSDTSSSNAFLNATSPNISIISAGKNNKYGHPHKSVMDRLSKISRVYETSKAGNITVYLSKYKIWISTYR